MSLLTQMFGSLAGWLMFILGVLLAGTVRGLFGGLRSKVAPAASGG